VEEKIREIREKVGKEKAITACSGGVDSTTCAMLGFKAIGKNSITIFIDDGLRRNGEPEEVISTLTELGLNPKLINAKEEFFKALEGLTDAEEKRKAFREKFYSLLGRVAKEERVSFLIQGTIAADVVETVGGIKTQHNILEQIGIDPARYGFKLIEPLKELYKPEVRLVARELGLPARISEKMPFPGPGLAIRVVGEVTPERVEILRKAASIVEEESMGIEAFQRFAVLLSDKATGIKEGKRVYGDIIVVRIVESKDAITAKAISVPHELLKRICDRITREIPTVVRCLYDITDKPPATIEFE
jgi:GMP synthase (glutamine-hydrolysing)